MALPTTEKTWQFEVNRRSTNLATDTSDKDKDVMLWMKNTLIGWSSSPWTVYQSCDGVSCGTEGDGVDRWLDVGDLVLANDGTNHSWFVWDIPVGSCQLCFDCRSTSRTARLVFSPEGLFSGGTVTNRPTAPDEVVTVYEEWNDGSYSEPYQCVNHMLSTTDGEVCIFMGNRNGAAVSMWCFFKAGSPEADWTAPYCFFRIDCYYSDTGLLYDRFMDGNYWYAGAKEAYTGDAGFTFDFRFCVEGHKPPGVNAGALGEIIAGRNKISGEYPMCPLMAVSFTAGAQGVKGYLPDVYFTGTATANGWSLEDDPVDPEFEWAVFGDIVVPWNGTIPVLG